MINQLINLINYKVFKKTLFCHGYVVEINLNT